MMAKSSVALACFFGGVDGLRSRSKQGLKFHAANAGVKVHNYREDAENWMVMFKDGTTEAQIEQVCQGHCPFMGNPSTGGFPFALVKGQTWLTKMLSEGSHGIELIEPDEVDSMIPEVEDETSIEALASWGLDAVGVPDRPATGKGVHVYVQDTGIRVTHKDFGGRAVPLIDFTSGSLVQCEEGSSSCARDRAGHGTHCAGTAVGTTFGVASDANVYAVKTLSDAGSGDRSWNVASIDWISSKGKKPSVISLSLGGTRPDEGYNAAISAATNNGVIVVVAAGNFAADSCGYTPAYVPTAITVGAVEDLARAAYSNFGSCNDIMAPGTSIKSASPVNDDMTAKLTGTSMACPHVSGAAAVLLEQNPSWNRDNIMSHLTNFGRKGIITGLKPGDPNLHLWIGRTPGPGKPSCPSYAQSSEPNYWGDCTCAGGKFCSLDGQNKNCPSAFGVGGWEGSGFEWACSDCKCY